MELLSNRVGAGGSVRPQVVKGRHRTPMWPLPCAHLAAGCSLVRCPLELLQRFPQMSLHEDVTDMSIDYPTHADVPEAQAIDTMTGVDRETGLLQPAVPNTTFGTGGDPQGLAGLRLSSGQRFDSWICQLRPHFKIDEYYNDVHQASMHDEIAGDDEDSEDDDLAHRDEPLLTRGGKREADPGSAASSTSVAGQCSALRAEFVAPSLRNTVSIAMPRRRNWHHPRNRLVVIPIVEREVEGGNAGLRGAACMMYLSEINDKVLKQTLVSLERDPTGRLSRRAKSLAVQRAFDASTSAIAVARESQKRARGATDCADTRQMFLGSTLSDAEVMDDAAIRAAVNDTMSALAEDRGVKYVFTHIPLMTIHYSRQTMRDPFHGVIQAPSVQSFPQSTFGIFDEHVASLRAAVIEQEKHLSHCGFVDSVTDYQTVVVMAWMLDEYSADGNEARISSGLSPERANTVFPRVVTVGAMDRCVDGAPSGRLRADGSRLDAAEYVPSDAPWFSVEFIPLDRTLRDRRHPSVMAPFCAPRECFEFTAGCCFLREIFLARLMLHFAKAATRRVLLSPLLAQYNAAQAHLQAAIMSRSFGKSPSERQELVAQVVEQTYALQRSAEFAILFDHLESREAHPTPRSSWSLQDISLPSVPPPESLKYYLERLSTFFGFEVAHSFPVGLLSKLFFATGVSRHDVHQLVQQCASDVPGVSSCDDVRGSALHYVLGDDDDEDEAYRPEGVEVGKKWKAETPAAWDLSLSRDRRPSSSVVKQEDYE